MEVTGDLEQDQVRSCGYSLRVWLWVEHRVRWVEFREWQWVELRGVVVGGT